MGATFASHRHANPEAHCRRGRRRCNCGGDRIPFAAHGKAAVPGVARGVKIDAATAPLLVCQAFTSRARAAGDAPPTANRAQLELTAAKLAFPPGQRVALPRLMDVTGSARPVSAPRKCRGPLPSAQLLFFPFRGRRVPTSPPQAEAQAEARAEAGQGRGAPGQRWR